MYLFSLIPIMMFFLLEFNREQSIKETKNNQKSNKLIGIILIMMIVLPILLHYTLPNLLITPDYSLLVGIGISVIGVWIRFLAIRTLGRFYSRNVGIQDQHSIIQTGIYRYVRHPGYLGTFITYLGFAISAATWIAVIINVLLFASAYIYRIRVEEETMIAEFHDIYLNYREKTWRIINSIYFLSKLERDIKPIRSIFNIWM